VKRPGAISIFLILLFSLIDWSAISGKKILVALAQETSSATCDHVGHLVSVQGVVLLKRREWSGYHKTAVGEPLCRGDRLQLPVGAQAIVECDDPNQNLWTVPSGKISGATSGCLPPNQPVYTLTNPITPTRDPLVRRILRIISPNNTLLLTSKPMLRWTSVPGATTYVVRVTGPWVNWVRETKLTQITYSGPPLKPIDQGYLLEVAADNGEVAKATFGLLNEKKADLVRRTSLQIERQNLASDAKTLALAELYIGQGLIAEATSLLEAAAAGGSRLGAIYYTLGELDANSELFPQAEENYFKAEELARSAGDTEGQASAATRLSQVFNLLGNSDRARYWSKQAQTEYQALGVQRPNSPQG